MYLNHLYCNFIVNLKVNLLMIILLNLDTIIKLDYASEKPTNHCNNKSYLNLLLTFFDYKQFKEL